MIIESNKVDIQAPAATIYNFLKDSNNMIHLLPKDNVSDFKATESECSFKVQGGVTITLVQNGGEEPNKLFLKSGEKSPFPFNLTIHINDNGDVSNGNIVFDGEVNMFLKMMVEKPLTNLFNYMSHKLQEHFA
jgi:carbon monoxide dehydrogenase subunit G